MVALMLYQTYNAAPHSTSCNRKQRNSASHYNLLLIQSLFVHSDNDNECFMSGFLAVVLLHTNISDCLNLFSHTQESML